MKTNKQSHFNCESWYSVWILRGRRGEDTIEIYAWRTNSGFIYVLTLTLYRAAMLFAVQTYFLFLGTSTSLPPTYAFTTIELLVFTCPREIIPLGQNVHSLARLLRREHKGSRFFIYPTGLTWNPNQWLARNTFVIAPIIWWTFVAPSIRSFYRRLAISPSLFFSTSRATKIVV